MKQKGSEGESSKKRNRKDERVITERNRKDERVITERNRKDERVITERNRKDERAVSYTHLTLPTRRTV